MIAFRRISYSSSCVFWASGKESSDTELECSYKSVLRWTGKCIFCCQFYDRLVDDIKLVVHVPKSKVLYFDKEGN